MFAAALTVLAFAVKNVVIEALVEHEREGICAEKMRKMIDSYIEDWGIRSLNEIASSVEKIDTDITEKLNPKPKCPFLKPWMFYSWVMIGILLLTSRKYVEVNIGLLRCLDAEWSHRRSAVQPAISEHATNSCNNSSVDVDPNWGRGKAKDQVDLLAELKSVLDGYEFYPIS